MSKKTIFSLIIILIFGIVVYLLLGVNHSKVERAIVFDRTVTLGSQTLSVAVANTNSLRNQGLSNSKNFANGQGMLFVFDSPNVPSFWMKDMNYPIDIIWINQDKKIVGAEEDVEPDTYPKTFSPKEPVMYALEVPVGFYYVGGFHVGDVLSF